MRLERLAEVRQAELTRVGEEIAAAETQIAAASAQQMEAEKALVAAGHQRDQAHNELGRIEQQLDSERGKSASCEQRQPRLAFAGSGPQPACGSRSSAGFGRSGRGGRRAFAGIAAHYVPVAAGRNGGAEGRAGDDVRASASAEAARRGLVEEHRAANDRSLSLGRQHEMLLGERAGLESSSLQLAAQAASLREEKARLEEHKVVLEDEWQQSRTRTAQLDESLRTRRQSLEELRADRSQRMIERARNEADRDHLRETS